MQYRFCDTAFSLFIVISILFGNRPNDPARVAVGNTVIRDVFCNHTAGPNHHIGADGDTGQNHCIAANPHIISHRNRSCILQKGIAHFPIDRMMSCVESTVRRNEHIVTKGDLSRIHKHTIVVGEEVIWNPKIGR